MAFGAIPRIHLLSSPTQPQPLTTFRSQYFPIKFRALGRGSSQQCKAPTVCSQANNTVRRSANYPPPTWDYDYLQSLGSDFEEGPNAERLNELKGQVAVALEDGVKHVDQLELIDVLQRLGVSYHFEHKINAILGSIHQSKGYHSNRRDPEDLHALALEFRLLRQHGYHVPQEVFNDFKDETGHFKACICKDIKGMLGLYEASFLSIEGESLLDEARDFTAKQLEEILLLQGKNDTIDSGNLTMLANHALELPLHWRMPRLEARWFIDMYEATQDANPIFLELAKLDFNMVQATHRRDLLHVFGWWRSTGLGQNLSFARDRIMENFFWTVGVIYEPEFGNCRRMLTKINALITTIDDVYDVYGTLDELQLFTDAIDRWDIKAMEQLPDYMKTCFLCLYNSINEMAYDVLKEQDALILPHLQKAWTDLCKSYLVEAKWYYTGYTPTLQQYMENAWISISAPLILVHAYFLCTNSITKQALGFLVSHPKIIQCSAMILRLANDLGTFSAELKRGDVPKSIQCFMHETGASEEEARRHLKHLIGETWKQINRSCVEQTPLGRTFVTMAMNLARMAECVYQYGDGHGNNEDNVVRSRIKSLLIESFPSC
uniref:Terpineol synthase n=1 Tax=Santalum album TaxID=35974 RepID=A0A678Y1I7_SANAL|nr:terpineol synthase [Santalum album]